MKKAKKTPQRPRARRRRAKPDGMGVKVAPRQPLPPVVDPVRPAARTTVTLDYFLDPRENTPAQEARRLAAALTDKQARFVAEYLIDLNAAGAARRAGYSVDAAEQQGYENLRKPEIAAAIAEGKARQLDTADLSAARVLEELRRLAFVNSRDYWNADGSAKHPLELTVEQGACLAGFEVLIKNAKAGDRITDTIHKFKLWDKVHSLELLAKHFALLVEKIEVKDTTTDARVARLVAARKRVTPHE